MFLVPTDLVTVLDLFVAVTLALGCGVVAGVGADDRVVFLLAPHLVLFVSGAVLLAVGLAMVALGSILLIVANDCLRIAVDLFAAAPVLI